MSETSLTYETAWPHIPEEGNLHLHSFESLKFHTKTLSSSSFHFHHIANKLKSNFNIFNTHDFVSTLCIISFNY